MVAAPCPYLQYAENRTNYDIPRAQCRSHCGNALGGHRRRHPFDLRFLWRFASFAHGNRIKIYQFKGELETRERCAHNIVSRCGRLHLSLLTLLWGLLLYLIIFPSFCANGCLWHTQLNALTCYIANCCARIVSTKRRWRRRHILQVIMPPITIMIMLIKVIVIVIVAG